MAKQITKLVAISTLDISLFVRASLDTNHVVKLAELMEHGVTLPPILITTDNKVIDGRHRIEACNLLGRTEILVEIITVSSDAELISLAYKANSGGALPPKKEDTEHTVMLLLEKRQTHQAIAELLGLPPSLTRGYIKIVKSKVVKRLVVLAKEAIASKNYTVAKAAEEFGLEYETLKNSISGNRGPRNKELAKIKQELAIAATSHSKKNARWFMNLEEAFEDGLVTRKDVEAILVRIEELNARSVRTLANWRARFEEKAKASLAVGTK